MVANGTVGGGLCSSEARYVVWDDGEQRLGDSDCHRRGNPFYQDGLGCDTWAHAVGNPIRKLAKKEYEESIGEMKHADRLMDRIFMLDALPNLQDLGKLMIGEDVPEALACDLKLESAAQITIKDGIAHCESDRDYVSRDLLQTILEDTEEHIDFLETQIDLLGKVGIRNYQHSQMGESS